MGSSGMLAQRDESSLQAACALNARSVEGARPLHELTLGARRSRGSHAVPSHALLRMPACMQ